MEARPRSWFSARGLSLRAPEGEREVDFFTAELHYWRVPRASWAACLAAIRGLGFELVSTYVPWSVHESSPDRFDWTGGRDLPAFLAEVERAGMLAVLKPGPHINAELTHFGYPERVLRDPAVQARTAADTPVWMPAPPAHVPGSVVRVARVPGSGRDVAARVRRDGRQAPVPGRPGGRVPG